MLVKVERKVSLASRLLCRVFGCRFQSDPPWIMMEEGKVYNARFWCDRCGKQY